MNKNKLYYCELCNYETLWKCNIEKHYETKKHKNNEIKDENNNKKYKCICNKEYLHRQSLYQHKKTCPILNKNIKEEEKNSKDQIIELLLEQNELLKKSGKSNDAPNITNNNQTNNNTINNTFNINVYLNENCKDAINLSDFIKNLTIDCNDLNFTQKHGLIEGISNVFIKHMNQLKNTERPIQCTDTKRETLYIKENDVWDKKDSKEKIRKAIGSVTKKQTALLNDYFEEQDPEWMEKEDKKDEWVSLVNTLTSDINPNSVCEAKILKNIAKETIIDKE